MIHPHTMPFDSLGSVTVHLSDNGYGVMKMVWCADAVWLAFD